MRRNTSLIGAATPSMPCSRGGRQHNFRRLIRKPAFFGRLPLGGHPNSKDRIGESLGNFVGDFLTPANGVRKLEGHNTANALTDWLVDRANSPHVAEAVCGLIPAILDALEDEDFRGFFDHPLMPQLRELDMARMAGKVLAL